MSLELNHRKLFEFKRSTLGTFDSNRQAVQAK